MLPRILQSHADPCVCACGSVQPLEMGGKMSAALVAVFKKADKIGGDRHEALAAAWSKLAEEPCS